MKKRRSVRVTVHHSNGVPKTRSVAAMVSLLPDFGIGVHDNNLENCYRGIAERLVLTKTGEPPIQPLPNAFEELLSTTLKTFRKLSTTTPVMGHEEFVMLYDGRKRAIYEKAMKKLKYRDLCAKDAHVRAFVKDEKFDISLKPNQCPRLIQPRSTMYNIELGCFIRPMERVIYKEINRLFEHDVVMKGLNSEQRAQAFRQHWEHFSDPVAIGIDAKRMDQHTSRSALEMEHKVYLWHTPAYHRDKLAKLLRYQLFTLGTCYVDDGWIKYMIPGGRCSGDMNTSLGNTLIMCLLTYDFLTALGIDYRFCNDGDDGVIIVERESLQKLSDLTDYFKQFGYDMQVEPEVEVFEKIEFCQSQPVLGPHGWIMCRKPSVVLKRDAFTTKSMDQVGQWNYYRGAVASCGLASMSGMPVLQEFYSMLGRGTEMKRPSILNSGLERHAKGMEYGYTEVPSHTRVSFYKAFGIEPDRQKMLEAVYRQHIPRYNPHRTHLYIDNLNKIKENIH